MSETIEQAVQSKYASRRHERPVQRPCGGPGRGRGVRLHAGRTGLDPRRGEHGPVLRQPHGLRQPAARRNGRGPGLRRGPGRVPGGAKVGPTGQGHRHRHDARDAGPWPAATPPRPTAASRLPTSSSTRRPSTSCRWPDASVDCVISNCVINLAPDKPAVFREIARVLKPGGRLAVSDIALKKPLPAEIGNDLMAYVGCIAGAILIEEYRRRLIEAGFARVEVIDTGADLNAYAKVENQAGCCCRRRRTQGCPWFRRVAAVRPARRRMRISIGGWPICCGGTT